MAGMHSLFDSLAFVTSSAWFIERSRLYRRSRARRALRTLKSSGSRYCSTMDMPSNWPDSYNEGPDWRTVRPIPNPRIALMIPLAEYHHDSHSVLATAPDISAHLSIW
jgi:hypothetical protein